MSASTADASTWMSHGGPGYRFALATQIVRRVIGRLSNYRSAPQIALGASTAEQISRDSDRWRAFTEAMAAAAEMSAQLVLEEDAEPASPEIWNDAVDLLVPLAPFAPTPLILPLRKGGISFEWHTAGIDLELRFRPGAGLYSLVHDARGKLPASQGRDRARDRGLSALRSLIARTR